MELTIDTSTSLSSLALSQEGRVVMGLHWHSAQNQTAELLPHLDFLLSRAGVGLSALSFIGVARGPGSFNGLRVGLATAKGLALALGLPLLGVSTLEAIAYEGRGVGMPLCPLLPAGMGRWAFALFEERGEGWHRLREEAIATPQEIAQGLKGPTLFCGELSSPLKGELKQLMGRRARFLVGGEGGRAGGAAALGWQRWQRGERDDPAALQPLYLRPPSITLSQEVKVVPGG